MAGRPREWSLGRFFSAYATVTGLPTNAPYAAAARAKPFVTAAGHAANGFAVITICFGFWVRAHVPTATPFATTVEMNIPLPPGTIRSAKFSGSVHVRSA